MDRGAEGYHDELRAILTALVSEDCLKIALNSVFVAFLVADASGEKWQICLHMSLSCLHIHALHLVFLCVHCALGGRGGGRGRGRGGGRSGGGGRGPSYHEVTADVGETIIKVVHYLKRECMQPIIVFSFSKRECENYAMMCASPEKGNLCFTSPEEQEAIQMVSPSS
jgi:hypothetical protein